MAKRQRIMGADNEIQSESFDDHSDCVVNYTYWNYVCNMTSTIGKWINYILPQTVLRIILIYALWILLHYLASHLYVYWCTPFTWTGLFMSAILIPAPHCQGLRWIIYNGATTIQAMWFLLGGYIIHFVESINADV